MDKKPRIVHPGNLQCFLDAYEPALVAAVRKHPDEYFYGEADVPKVVERMGRSFAKGDYNLNGYAIANACRAIGIKHTRTAIDAFICL